MISLGIEMLLKEIPELEEG